MGPERWQQIKDLFAAAEEVPASECAAFLDRACRGDAELRAEVEVLLLRRDQACSFLDQPAIGLLALEVEENRQAAQDQASTVQEPAAWRTAAQLSSSVGANLTGEKLGPYEVIALLGSGGMGLVYKARDSRLGRLVAVKVLPPTKIADAEWERRFLQEARAASALNHPNIITIYEIGWTSSQEPYLVMEYIPGQALRQLLGGGALALNSVLEIAVHIAEGLSAAHQSGIVHRDLKPENIMLGTRGVVKILDFGLAKLVCPEATAPEGAARVDRESITHSGMIVGTANYMSPEQASGKIVDFRSDQFSFGALLYEMLTAKRPFERGNTMETLAAVLREQPAAITQLNPQVPPPLQWIVERCLAKDPQQRYPSTAELAQDLALVRDHLAEAPVKTRGTAPAPLPAPLTALIGRETELRFIRDLLREGVRLITLTGTGGSGKTRLAVEIARAASDEFKGGVFFLELAPLTDAELVTTAVAQAFGVCREPGKPTAQSVREQLGRSLESPTLLVLDNFEQVVAAAPFVGELLACCARLSVIVTSREALHIHGEQEFPVLPLEVPDYAHAPLLQAIRRSPAVKLFVQRASAARPAFALTEENAAAVAGLCARLDGLPLALELAAPGVKMLSPAALLARLADPLQPVTRASSDLPTRHQTLRRAIEWSYNLLSPQQQKLFRRMSIFAGGCTLEAAEAVCAAYDDLGMDVFEGLASLVDKSLVQQIQATGGEDRFAMLETIRAYAAEQLLLSGDQAGTARAQAAYCLVLAEEGSKELMRPSENTAWLRRFDLEHANFRKALDWLMETGNAEWAMRLGVALERFWELREYLAEGHAYLMRILQLPAAQGRNKLRARTLFALCNVTGAQDRPHFTSGTEALDIFRELDDKHGVLVLLNGLGAVYCELGCYGLARAQFEESLLIAKELGDKIATAHCLSNVATAMKLEGVVALARSKYEESLTLFFQLNDPIGIASTLNLLGDLALEYDDDVRAEILYGQSMVLFQSIDDQWGIANTLRNLGNLARNRRNFTKAQLYYKESLKTFRTLGRTLSVAQVLEAFASCTVAEGKPECAITLAGAAAALRRTHGIPLAPYESTALETGLESARREIGSSAATACWNRGWATQSERAIEYALAL